MSKRNNKVFLIITLLVLLVFVLLSIFIKPGETPESFGLLSLLPPLIAIVLAFITKEVILSLFLGVFTGAIMTNGWNPFLGFLRTLDQYIVGSLADGWNAAIIIFTLSIGGMIALISKMGGTKAIANALAAKANNSRKSQLYTAILGCLVFFDDYANTLIVGPTMRPLADKMKVSREKLSYIVDSTAAPVVGLALVSTWIGYEIGLFKEAFDAINVNVNAYSIFIKSIPYTFYNLFALALVFFVSAKGKDFGPMYKAEVRARKEGKVLRDGAEPLANLTDSGIQAEEGTPLKKRNAVIPILTLVIVSFVGLWYNGYGYALGDIPGLKWYTWTGIRESFGYADASVVLIWGAIVASIVAGILGLSQKILNLRETFETWVQGSKSLLITAIILVLAWSLGSVTGDVGTADYLVGALSDTLNPNLLPIFVFLISCIVAFATGTSWGTMAIVIPLAVPLANAFVNVDPANSPLILATLTSVLSGSIFGDHCSPISDTTVMSSMASAADHIDHVKTQIPYALTGAGFTILGYLLIGVVKIPVWIVLPLGIAGIWAVVHFIGKDPEKAVK